MISALVLGFMFIRILVVDRRIGPLAVLLALCALQGLIISLAQHYMVAGAFFVQPITASMIPPMAWVAFQSTAVRKLEVRDALHLLVPLGMIAVMLGRPFLLDTFLPALFVGYGGMIVWSAMQGADALPRMRLETGEVPGIIWQVIGWTFVASALSDALIVVAQVMGAGYLQPWIVSIYSTGTLVLIGVLTLSGALDNSTSEAEEETTVARKADAQDMQVMEQLERYMQTAKPFLNPDLTMTQLSRRIQVPVKQLSGAINRVTGENVSRYINAARIAAAQKALLAGDTVTAAMFGSGFNTKSNFNREFLRISGVSPSEWLNSQKPK
ncbi:helix-turn-helix domain-containing protein [Sulfitobacter donghicola]|nr:AraC family transcriptional regulator [Sulfitobacter donghicola]